MLNWNWKYFWPMTFALLGVLGGAMLLFGQEGRGSWRLQLERSGDEVRLTIRETQPGRSWTNTFDIGIAELRGLSRSTLEQGGPAKFELVRDAGRLLFEGDVRNGSGSGDFRFEPNPNFSKDLSALGYAAPNEEDLFSMALLNVSLDYARAIRDSGMRASTKELGQLRIHGVSTAFLRDLKEAGYNLTTQDIVQLRIHGVQPNFIQETKHLGYNFSSRELVDLRIHGVNAAYLKKLQDAGFRNLTAAQIAKLRIHGID